MKPCPNNMDVIHILPSGKRVIVPNRPTYYVYLYTCRESGKQYVGATSNITRRSYQHANGGSHARAFTSAIKKYGIEAFTFEILSKHHRVDIAAQSEQEAIRVLRTLSPNGYNLQAGAPFTKYAGPMSDATKAKQSALHLGQFVSKETRAKHSVAMMGKRYSLGHHHTDESKQKISVAMIGTTRCVGHHHTEKTKAKMSASKMGNKNRLGYHYSAEGRAKMSASIKRMWALKHAAQQNIPPIYS
jgi:group I intron endonuclease